MCDDELIFLEEMKDYLKKLSKETKIPISGVFCEDGKTALSYFRRNRDIDLFILDIKLKGDCRKDTSGNRGCENCIFNICISGGSKRI